jgi:hypothetical protein
MQHPNSEEIGLAAVDAVALDNIKDVGATLADSILAPVLDHSLLESIPVVGIVFKMAKTGVAIRERLFIKKLGTFLLELQSVPVADREKFVKELNEDPIAKQKIGENLILLIDRLDDIQKASMLGKFFGLYIIKRISQDIFRRYSIAVDRAYLPDLEALLSLTSISEITQIDLTEIQMQELYMLGLASAPIGKEIEPTHKDYEELSGSKSSTTVWLTELGIYFRKFLSGDY